MNRRKQLKDMTTNFDRSTPLGGDSDQRDGIILLVVLGLLTLFSILGVSYLVFTSRQRVAAAALNRAETNNVDPGPLLDEALKSILVGSNGPDSSTWGNDVIGDLYGIRDSIEAAVVPPQLLITPTSETSPDVLLGNQFLRIPTALHLNVTTATSPLQDYLPTYPYRRNDARVERRYPGYAGLPNSGLPLNLVRRPSFEMDDELNGQLLTFRDGPLEGISFEIARYFGDHAGAPNGREQLSGQLIIDLRPALAKTITIGDQSQTLKQWIQSTATNSWNLASLVYDIDPFAVTPATAEPYSNFYINGRMLNGPGLGWDRPRVNVTTLRGRDRTAPVNAGTNPAEPFNLNEVISTDLAIAAVEQGTATGLAATPVRNQPYQYPTPSASPPSDPSLPLRGGPDVPVALQGHYALHRLAPDPTSPTAVGAFLQDLPPGDTDEPYDAPDFNNMFLSYFPSDEILGEDAPSFVRPALINWIVNNVTDGPTPTADRLRQALIALSRSTMRPIPLTNTPTTPSNLANRGSGVKALNFATFNGGNNTPGLGQPINFNSTDPVYLQTELLNVAHALAGRDDDLDGVIDSWDVDNDGDGEVDSVWIDAGLPLVQSPDGRLVKPMVSYLVEDLGGRVNVNLAGNILQARDQTLNVLNTGKGPIQTAAPNRTLTQVPNVAPGLVYTNVPGVPTPTGEAINAGLPNGWGYGPAEIDIRRLFLGVDTGGFGTSTVAVNATPSPPLISPYPAINMIRGPQRLVAERLGMFSQNYGRVPSFANMDDAGHGRIVTPPGYLFSQFSGLNQTNGINSNDFIGMIRRPNRPNLHVYQHPQGLPVDAYGRGSIAQSVAGDEVVSNTSAIALNGGALAGDTFDDPYEFAFNAVREPDAPYRLDELAPLLNHASLDREVLGGRLVELIDDYHNDPAAGIDLLDQLRKAFADSVTTHSNSVATIRGGLPSEYFDNTLAATSAGSPQQHIKFTMENENGGAASQEINAIIWELMPEELRAGRKFNLNRPFGNGYDDNFDEVIDDDHNGVWNGINPPDAYLTNHLRGDNNQDTTYSTDRGVSVQGEVLDNTAITAATPARLNVSPRAQFARHLYVMTMMLTRDALNQTDFEFPHNFQNVATFNSVFYDSGGFTADTDTSIAQRAHEFSLEFRAWKIAQWAANVADFRDDDGVMTRFDYDPNPFNGWNVDLHDPRTYRTVWGLERPELSLEESFAMHDRRVRDTNVDPSAEKTTLGADGSASRGDLDMDQYRIPQGSLMLEVRNNRNPAPPRLPADQTDPVSNVASVPAEMYDQFNGKFAMNLGQLAPAGAGVPQLPVWRVAISETHSAAAVPGPSAAPDVAGNTVSGAATSPFYEASPDFLAQPDGSLAGVGPPVPNIDRDTMTLEPTNPQFFETVAPGSIEESRRRRAVERVIFFTPGLNSADVAAMALALPDVTDAGQIFYNRFAANQYANYRAAGGTQQLFLDCGQHVVIGPRAITPVGSRTTNGGLDVANQDSGQPAVPFADFESPQQFLLGPHQFEYIAGDGDSQMPTVGRISGPNTAVNPAIEDASIRPVVGVLAAADPPAAWTTITTPIGINVSEPLPYQGAGPGGRTYYPEPTDSLDSGNGFPVDAYRDYTAATPANLPDVPFDSSALTSELVRTLGPTGVQSGTRLSFKTAYLQRLADPTQPFHPTFNPYRSVDYITIDLTVFNGSDNNDVSLADMGGLPIWKDPEDEDPFNNPAGPTERFATRYKSGNSVHTPGLAAPHENLAHCINTVPPAITPASGDPNNFPYDLSLDPGVVDDPDDLVMPFAAQATHSSSLGYANHTYGPRYKQGPLAPTGTGAFNEAQTSVSSFVGMPFQNYRRSITWFNRPYVSAEELMWVPTSGPGRLGLEFRLPQTPAEQINDQYSSANNITSVPNPPVAPATDTGIWSFNLRFKHLWNYFTSSDVFAYTPGVAITEPYSDIPTKQPSPNFHRLLEWVGVPAPFDFEADFVSPEASPLDETVDPLYQSPLDMKTFGPINYMSSGITPPTPDVNVNGDPRSWTNANPGPNVDFVPSSGIWNTASPIAGSWNGFWTTHIAMEKYRPPFNIRSSQFRSGRINLNTLKSIRCYKALMAGYSSPGEMDDTVAGGNRYPNGVGAFFPEFVRSLRSYTPDGNAASQANNWFEPGGNPLQTFDHDGVFATPEVPSFDRNIPTQFAGVFKSSMGGIIAPLESMRQELVAPGQQRWEFEERDATTGSHPRLENPEVNSTLLRGEFSRAAVVQAGKPVAQRPAGDAAISAAESHATSVINQQLGLTRLSNMATDQSNVFAVWMTIGLFEVDTTTMSVRDEIGADVGNAERYRGFYIIDRSKPVMYEPGRWNNARETVVYESVR